MFGSDTAKRDLFLITLGLLSAAFFYGFYAGVHPLNIADSSLGEDAATERVTTELNRMGYTEVKSSLTTYQINSDILDLVQVQLNESEFEGYGGNSLVRRVMPAFKWSSQRQLQRKESQPDTADTSGDDRLVTADLFENGELMALRNPGSVLPHRIVENGYFEQYHPEISVRIQAAPVDSSMANRFRFRIPPEEVTQREDQGNGRRPQSLSQGGLDEFVVLNQEDAVQIAQYHLERSGWPAGQFEAGYPEETSTGGSDVARIEFSGTLPEISPSSIQLTVEVLPSAALLSMEYSLVSEVTDTAETWSEIRFAVTVITIFLITIWLLVLFFVRLRLRLIDIKLSVLAAVFAGFTLPLTFLMRQVFAFVYTYQPISIQEGFGLFLGLGFMAAISSLVFFITTAIGDSLTRENWIEKLKTFDLVRISMVYNRPVGLVLVRSVAYAYLLVAVITGILYMMPEGYITVAEQFRGNQTLLPSLEIVVISVLLYLIIVQAVFMISVGKLSSITKKPLWIVGLSGLMFILLHHVPVNFGPWSADLLIIAATGLTSGVIFYKEDFLTTFLALALMGIHLLAAGGWVMEASPDASVFYVSLLITFILLVLGGLGFYNGEPAEKLPEYVPEYVNDLKRDERIKQELQIARTVQKSFLPGTMPNGKGIEIAAICNPALETGGDYYDFIDIDDHRLAVAIGDVSGKGIEAAFYMTFTKGVLHALCGEYTSSADILAKINSLFIKNARRGTFISLIFGVIDYRNSTFKFSRGGHNPLLHFCSSSGKIKEYKPSGIGLGMANEDLFRTHISESSIELKSGDILVLFTDGVVEATNSKGLFYGDERLHSVIKRSSRRSADEIIEALSADLMTFGEGSELHDDMTAIVIKKT